MNVLKYLEDMISNPCPGERLEAGKERGVGWSLIDPLIMGNDFKISIGRKWGRKKENVGVKGGRDNHLLPAPEVLIFASPPNTRELSGVNNYRVPFWNDETTLKFLGVAWPFEAYASCYFSLKMWGRGRGKHT